MSTTEGTKFGLCMRDQKLVTVKEGHGRFGKPGDDVCTIKGARMPYVSRKFKEAAFPTGLKQPLHNLVGYGFVHGFRAGRW